MVCIQVFLNVALRLQVLLSGVYCLKHSLTCVIRGSCSWNLQRYETHVSEKSLGFALRCRPSSRPSSVDLARSYEREMWIHGRPRIPVKWVQQQLFHGWKAAGKASTRPIASCLILLAWLMSWYLILYWIHSHSLIDVGVWGAMRVMFWKDNLLCLCVIWGSDIGTGDTHFVFLFSFLLMFITVSFLAWFVCDNYLCVGGHVAALLRHIQTSVDQTLDAWIWMVLH